MMKHCKYKSRFSCVRKCTKMFEHVLKLTSCLKNKKDEKLD